MKYSLGSCFPFPCYWLLGVTISFAVTQVTYILYKCCNRSLYLKACLTFCKVFFAFPCVVLLTLVGGVVLWLWQEAECAESLHQVVVLGIYELIAVVQVLRLGANFKKLYSRYVTLNQTTLRRRNSNSFRLLLERTRVTSSSFTEPELERLTSFTFDSVPEKCSICLDLLEVGESVKAMPSCRHTFHSNCIDGWLLTDPRCPLCKANIRSVLDSRLSVNA